MNWYKVSQRNRGLYNQPQTDEHRGKSQALKERYQENEIVEGEHVDMLKQFWQQGKNSGNWINFNNYIKKLQNDGFDSKRIDSMISRATIGKI
ncbi:MAG: hypothetical protein ACOCP8_07885 [archaeon]